MISIFFPIEFFDGIYGMISLNQSTINQFMKVRIPYGYIRDYKKQAQCSAV